MAQRRFYSRQVIPICTDWFGETGEDFEKVSKRLARKVAARDDDMIISPLVNADRKGGAFPIMLQQFRRVIGARIVRGQAKHKLGRLHDVRATAADAAATCRRHHSNYRWKHSQNRRSS